MEAPEAACHMGLTQQEVADLIERHIDEMAQVEHNRWNTEKLLSGYRALTEEETEAAKKDANEKQRLKSAPYYAHLDICSFEMLKQVDPDVLQYDSDVLRTIPYL